MLYGIPMPRIARVVIPRCPHHITQRGNRREEVFHDHEDYVVFLKLLEKYCQMHGVAVECYCLMPNHLHLVVVPEKEGALGKSLKPVFLRYAQHINWKHTLTGRLWQGRFFSCPLDEEHHWAAIRYAEQNPVRAGLIGRAEEYPFSSAAIHCGLKANRFLRGIAGHQREIGNWSEWLAEGESAAHIDVLRRNSRTGRPAGSEAFLKRVEKKTGRALKAKSVGRPKCA